MKKIFSLFAVIWMALLGIQAQTVDPQAVDGVIYVKFVDSYPLHFQVNEDRSVNPDEFPFLQDVFDKYEVVGMAQTLYLFNDQKLLRTLKIGFTAKEQVTDFIKELAQFPEIEYAEKVALKRPLYTPNDPYYGTVNSVNVKWHLDRINASTAWDLQQGSASVKVAIVDNAVWGDHPDLQISGSNLCKVYGSYYNPSYLTNSTTAANPPTSVNQNTVCSDINSCLAYDWSHGTHCAGLVGAKNNNSVGVASIGGGVTLMGVRIAEDDGSMYFANEGVQWAANNGAKVISMSYGGTYAETTEQNLMQTCYNNGIILVAAAGNEGDYGNEINYPAGFNTVIGVASIDNNGKLSDFSQYGAGRADIASPGGYYAQTGAGSYNNIYSTTFSITQYWKYIQNMGGTAPATGVNYDGMQGTSMACPIVAGLCGLLASAYPSITPAQALSCLQTTATSLASGSAQIDGNGYINAQAAVQCAITLGGGTVTPVTECAQFTNLLETDQAGFLFGQDHENSIFSYAEYFANSTTLHIDTLGFYTYTVSANNPATSSITVKLYSESGGVPSTLLSTRTLTYNQLTDGGWTDIVYSTPVTVTGNFFAVFELNSTPNTDTLDLVSTSSAGRTAADATAYCYYDNTWSKISDLFTSSGNPILASFYAYFHACPDEDQPQPCNAPTNLTATPNHSLGRIHLTWTSSSGAVSYNVYRNGTQIASSITSTSYTDMTATVGITYSYTVKAVCQSGVSAASNVATAKLNNPSNAINELNAQFVSVYPNPAKDVLFVQLSNTLLNEIEIIDMTGRIVARYDKIGTYKTEISLNNFSDAVYFIKITAIDGTIHFNKFIKQ